MDIRKAFASWLLRSLHPKDPALAEWIGGQLTASGISVTADSAMRLATFYTCVRIISETMASLPLVVYKKQKKGGREKATNHWTYKVLHSKPNGSMTSFGWREMSTAHICLRGSSYSRIIFDPRGNTRLIPLHPDRVRPVLLESGQIAYKYWPLNGPPQVYLEGEILRVPFMMLDGVEAITPVQVQRETIGGALAAQDYGNRFWANDTRPTGGWVELDGDFKDDKERKKWSSRWHENTTGINQHTTQFLPKGMKYHPFGIAPSDAQYIENKKASQADVAAMWRVPAHMAGVPNSVTYASAEQFSIDFVVYTMQPWVTRWEQAINTTLFTETEQEEYFAEFLLDGLLRGDANTRAMYFRTAILTGWMNRAEVREKENLSYQEGLEEFLTPLNMIQSDLLSDYFKGKIDGQNRTS